MAYFWDSNILRHYAAEHPVLRDNLNRVPRQAFRNDKRIASERRPQLIEHSGGPRLPRHSLHRGLQLIRRDGACPPEFERV